MNYSSFFFFNVFLFQDVANGLKHLLEYEGNVEEDMGLTFQVRLITPS